MNDKIFDRLKQEDGINPILHHFTEHADEAARALLDFGFAGVVTNVAGGDGFTSNPENIRVLDEALKQAKARGLEYWLYDEVGYPSGQACGLTLEGHENLEAKGFYMRKFEAFTKNEKFVYSIDGTSDKIVYAAKYKIDLSNVCEAYLQIDSAIPLTFSKRRVKINLEVGEAAYVFVERRAYEGAHTVHNISSRKKYINILDRRAVKRFIDVAYRPIAEGNAEIFRNARAAFTDEPSLMTGYAREHEEYNYALAPYSDRLFREFEKRRGYSILPLLPLLFEETDKRFAQVRVDFYETVGELVAENYTGQLQTFCKKHGTMASGHYLAEEHIWEHVETYGNYARVLANAGYPGMDILQCTPEKFYFNAPKFLQMIAEKKGADGFMVEYCPFFNREAFNADPFENTVGTLGILYMYGARKINSYLLPALAQYDGEGAEKLSAYRGGLTKEQSLFLNGYVRRMAAALRGRKTRKTVCVYYAIEDAQAKFAPRTCGKYARDEELIKQDVSFELLAQTLLKNGEEYVFVDADDLLGGVNADTVVVPECDFIRKDVYLALKRMAKKGVKVVFLEREVVKVAACSNADVEKGKREKTIVSKDGAETLTPDFGTFASYDRLLSICSRRRSLLLKAPKNVLRQSYEGGLTMFYNNERKAVTLTAERDSAIYDPASGARYELKKGENARIESYRVLFAEPTDKE